MGMVSALLAAIAVECGLPENPREVGISPKHPPNDVAVEKFNEAINRALGGDAGAKQGG